MRWHSRWYALNSQLGCARKVMWESLGRVRRCIVLGHQASVRLGIKYSLGCTRDIGLALFTRPANVILCTTARSNDNCLRYILSDPRSTSHSLPPLYFGLACAYVVKIAASNLSTRGSLNKGPHQLAFACSSGNKVGGPRARWPGTYCLMIPRTMLV